MPFGTRKQLKHRVECRETIAVDIPSVSFLTRIAVMRFLFVGSFRIALFCVFVTTVVQPEAGKPERHLLAGNVFFRNKVST